MAVLELTLGGRTPDADVEQLHDIKPGSNEDEEQCNIGEVRAGPRLGLPMVFVPSSPSVHHSVAAQLEIDQELEGYVLLDGHWPAADRVVDEEGQELECQRI